MKPIRLSDHAQHCTGKRGFTLNEVEDAIYDSQGRLAGLEILDAQNGAPAGSGATSTGSRMASEEFERVKRFGGTDTICRVELEGIGS